MSILLGCIADDFTGATDLANTLVKLTLVLTLGSPKFRRFAGSGLAAMVVAMGLALWLM